MRKISKWHRFRFKKQIFTVFANYTASFIVRIQIVIPGKKKGDEEEEDFYFSDGDCEEYEFEDGEDEELEDDGEVGKLEGAGKEDQLKKESAVTILTRTLARAIRIIKDKKVKNW